MSEPQFNGRLLTVEDVAKHLSVPKSWVYQAAEAGKLPSFKVGRYRRFSLEALEQYLEAQRQG
jgi:excisionase family DNA binding protein